jgi:hypothetical protein
MWSCLQCVAMRSLESPRISDKGTSEAEDDSEIEEIETLGQAWGDLLRCCNPASTALSARAIFHSCIIPSQSEPERQHSQQYHKGNQVFISCQRACGRKWTTMQTQVTLPLTRGSPELTSSSSKMYVIILLPSCSSIPGTAPFRHRTLTLHK